MAGSPDGAGAHAAVETYCFRVDAFVEPTFTVEDFVKECRLRVPMAELKTDLGEWPGVAYQSVVVAPCHMREHLLVLSSSALACHYCSPLASQATRCYSSLACLCLRCHVCSSATVCWFPQLLSVRALGALGCELCRACAVLCVCVPRVVATHLHLATNAPRAWLRSVPRLTAELDVHTDQQGLWRVSVSLVQPRR
jgi:hypothetical protein